jgi:hypothetical protein
MTINWFVVTVWFSGFLVGMGTKSWIEGRARLERKRK